ncbi:MAG: hypothetical protein KUG77_22995 [Nannocystaceae bacterium]|nr:hypothetical protein [Nannocystaceae bacterium]
MNIEHELDEMTRELSQCPEPLMQSGSVILDKIRGRNYTEYAEFRADLTTYLDQLDARNAAGDNALEAITAWQESAYWLKEDYWRAFLFDPDTEMSDYSI